MCIYITPPSHRSRRHGENVYNFGQKLPNTVYYALSGAQQRGQLIGIYRLHLHNWIYCAYSRLVYAYVYIHIYMYMTRRNSPFAAIGLPRAPSPPRVIDVNVTPSVRPRSFFSNIRYLRVYTSRVIGNKGKPANLKAVPPARLPRFFLFPVLVSIVFPSA